MTILIDDPLISAMAIDRVLPLHESARRLRELYPQCPRVYGVAVLGDVSVRRWWPLTSALSTDRLQAMFDAAAMDMDRRSAARQLAATLVHTVIGRVVALVVLEARAWDTGLENLWVHVDSDGVIDWAGVVDPTVRVLSDDPNVADSDGVVRLPSEAALTTWVAHRSHRTLEPLFAKLHAVSGGALPIATMWHIVGSMVVAAATQVPQLAGADELAAMRRGQAVLDALVGFGLPVRGLSAARRGRAQPLAKLGQPCLCCLHRAINDRDGVLRAAVTPGLFDRRAPCIKHGARLYLEVASTAAARPQSLVKWYIRYESLPRCSSRYISVPGAPANSAAEGTAGTAGTWRPTRSRYRGELLSSPRSTSALISRFDSIRIGRAASAASHASYSRNPRKSA